jgi:hypothetical protein
MTRRTLARRSVNYKIVDGTGPAIVCIGDTRVVEYGAASLDPGETAHKVAELQGRLIRALDDAGYVEAADPGRVAWLEVLAILIWLSLVTAMVYGPFAAMLVDMFPARATSIPGSRHGDDTYGLRLRKTLHDSAISSSGCIEHSGVTLISR